MPTREEIRAALVRITAEHAGKIPKPVRGKEVAAPNALKLSLAILRNPCPDLGERRPGPCGSALYKCGRFGDITSTSGPCVDAQRRCAECDHHPTRRAFPPVTTRHLLYHVYPRHNSTWRERVLRLRERIDLFNGRKVIAVATDLTTDGADHVEDALAGTGCEFVTVKNDPTRREVATFLPLFEPLSSLTEPGHATLYGHAKGVCRPRAATCHRWAEVLEETMFDWGAVAPVLDAFPLAGSFRKRGRGWPVHQSASEWHYSGSWHWFRNAELFTKSDWRRIDDFWSGIEPFPSLHFPFERAGCVFHEGMVSMNLYDRKYWDAVVEPAYATFRAPPPKLFPPNGPLLPPAAWEHVFAPLAGKRVGYVAAPGNAGDHLIEAATFQLLAHFGVKWVIGPDPTADVLLIAGGGSMGAPHYGLCADARARALAAGPPVWVLPQSWHAPDPDDAKFAKLFARDPESQRHAPAAVLAPDLALGLSCAPFPDATEGRGVFLRRDIEGLFADVPCRGDPVQLCAGLENPGWAYLALAARHEEIVTDRRHFAVAGLLAGRKVTLLPNWNHANRAVWEHSLKALGCKWADKPR